jgi:hypothetical protein
MARIIMMSATVLPQTSYNCVDRARAALEDVDWNLASFRNAFDQTYFFTYALDGWQ